MGIYDREYYRREGPSFLGSFANRGRACKWLIGINVACFLVQVFTQHRVVVTEAFGEVVAGMDPGWFSRLFELDAEAVAGGQVWRLLTYAFLHDTGSLWHIAFNMLFLWWFGADLEDVYGTREFLTFYLVAAVLGGAFFEVGWLMTHAARLCIGASGAVTAVMVLCALHWPMRIIYIWFFPVPIWLFVLFNVAQDVFGLIGGGAGRVAVTVHLGGAAFGYVYHKANWRVSGFSLGFLDRLRRLGKPRLRVYREEPPEPVAVPRTPPAAEADEHLEAKLDAVLEKVARFGQASLTESERNILLRASEAYRRKRT